MAHAAGTTFTPRLTAPDASNKYYYNANYNVFYACGYGMPNCTAYAYGRAYEILGTEPDLSWASAGQWYDYNRNYGSFKYGQTAKVGAIACWSYSGGGHVAVVEAIDSNGNMTLSNSAYNRPDLNFYLTYAHTSDSNPGGSSYWNFQGYIYLIDSVASVQPTTTKATVPTTTKATVPTTTKAVDHTSSYKTGVYQATSSLCFRSGAGLSYGTSDYVDASTKLVITQTYYADGYNWGKTTYNGMTGWVSLDYCKYVAAKLEETTTVAPTTVPATTKAPATTVAATTKAAQQPTVPKIYNLRGDANGDGYLTILDATLIQQYLARMIEMTTPQLRLSDFDGNGKVTIDDVTNLQRYLSYD